MLLLEGDVDSICLSHSWLACCCNVFNSMAVGWQGEYAKWICSCTHTHDLSERLTVTPHLLDLRELFRKWVLRHDDNFMAKQCVAREVYVIQLSTELLYRSREPTTSVCTTKWMPGVWTFNVRTTCGTSRHSQRKVESVLAQQRQRISVQSEVLVADLVLSSRCRSSPKQSTRKS